MREPMEEETQTQVAEEEGAEEQPEQQPADNPDAKWYVVHTYSGYENKVKTNLEHRVDSMGAQDQIFQVVIPTEDEIEIRDGQRRTVQRKVFPGYVLVKMLLTDHSWHVVRNTPGVTGFVGSGTKPTPLLDEEAKQILKAMRREAPKVKVSFSKGERVKVIDGPFTDFTGIVDDINVEKGKVWVLVSFFGRETRVELDFLQVARA